jgi:hypothetical protein
MIASSLILTASEAPDEPQLNRGIQPSMDLIDRQGRVRYWWYGELDWQGAGNQKIARQQIEQLVAEPAETIPK